MDALNKRLRGVILEMLKNISPTAAEENAIIAAYYQYYTPNDIRRALSYLADSGYLSCEKNPHPFRKHVKISSYRIAPKGVNLLEGDAQDVGIAVFDEEDA